MAYISKKPLSVDTDFHSHLLPDIDCPSAPDTVSKLIKIMSEAGIKNIVLTPHFYPHWHNNVKDFIQKRNKKILALKQKLKENGITSPEFYPAAEVLLLPGLENLEDLELLCIENTKTLLIEMPDPPWVEALHDTLYDIKRLGYDIVIAHAERYGKSNAEKLIQSGYAIQLNSGSVSSMGMKRMCSLWAKSGYVYALGSDTHVGSSVPSYKSMPKATQVLSDSIELIQKRMHSLIGKNQ